jgi:hypothetical protein
MRNDAKGFILKEYGSWSVLSVSFLAGLFVSREFSWQAVPLFAALGLLINSKQAFMKWTRRKEDRAALLVFLSQLTVAAAVMIAIFRGDVPRLLPLLLFPAAYLISNRLAGEHHVVTEILGFTLISLAAVLAKFLVTGGVDVRLFIAMAFYFSAGVFKVKTLVLKKTRDRILTVLWLVLTVFAYRGFHIQLLILLPLVDNLLAAVALYNVKLKTVGWTEVIKSLVFLGLMTALY